MTSRRPLVAIVAALSLFAVSCGGGSSAAGTVETATGAATEQAATDQVVETPTPAPPGLVASTVSGEQIDFGSLQGQDVLLWFWAPW